MKWKVTQMIELVNKHVKSYYYCMPEIQEGGGKTKHVK